MSLGPTLAILSKDPVVAATLIHTNDRLKIYNKAFSHLERVVYHGMLEISFPWGARDAESVRMWIGHELWLYRFVAKLGELVNRPNTPHKDTVEKYPETAAAPVWFGCARHLYEVSLLGRWDDIRRIKARLQRQGWSRMVDFVGSYENRPASIVGRFRYNMSRNGWHGEDWRSFDYTSVRRIVARIYSQSWLAFQGRNHYLRAYTNISNCMTHNAYARMYSSSDYDSTRTIANIRLRSRTDRALDGILTERRERITRERNEEMNERLVRERAESAQNAEGDESSQMTPEAWYNGVRTSAQRVRRVVNREELRREAAARGERLRGESERNPCLEIRMEATAADSARWFTLSDFSFGEVINETE